MDKTTVVDDPFIYHCTNTNCSLGTVHNPGRFSAGMSAEQKHLVTGEPVESFEDGVDCGEGFCPNCGEEGVPADSESGE